MLNNRMVIILIIDKLLNRMVLI